MKISEIKTNKSMLNYLTEVHGQEQEIHPSDISVLHWLSQHCT